MKNEFIKTYKHSIKRDGSEEMLQWLFDSDFFTAPASTKYHMSKEGGLVEHSLNVFNRFIEECIETPANKKFKDVNTETIAVCGLLHDVCKANYYKTELRNSKNENGQWVKVPYYTVEDAFPYGHGEKSVYIISQFMKLTEEEIMAIRWHMGGFDDAAKGGSFSIGTAFEKYPIALLLHTADMKATYIDEVK